MRFYNQTSKRLVWDEPRPPIEWEPFGAADVPDELAEHLRLQKLPVEVTPIPPEVKAKDTLDAASAAARSDEVRLLKLDLDAARAAERTAKQTAEELTDVVASLSKEIEGLRASLKSSADKLSTSEADKRAAETLLEETGRRLQVAEDTLAKGKQEALVAAEKDGGKKASK